jgi:hypothetical protein
VEEGKQEAALRSPVDPSVVLEAHTHPLLGQQDAGEILPQYRLQPQYHPQGVDATALAEDHCDPALIQDPRYEVNARMKIPEKLDI